MTEGTTCYERDEILCEDQMCLRVGCRMRESSRVEAICRAVCQVDGVDPDSDVYGDGCDPQWARYADAVATVLNDYHDHHPMEA